MFKKITLKNGLRILLVPLKGNKTVTVQVLVSAGSDYENEKISGLSHFLEHMCFQGTEKRPNTGDVSRELDELGAQSNAFTGKQYTGYWAKAHKKQLPKLIDIVSDVYLNPNFVPEAIEKEKGVVIEEMKMYEDLPYSKVGEVFDELLYGNTPAGRPIIGYEKIVRSLTREDLIAYREKHYTAKNTVVVVSGGFDEKKTIELLKKSFEKIKAKKRDALPKIDDVQKKPKVKIHYKETDQAHIILGFRSLPIGHKDNYKMDVLETVLGGGMSSRLFRKLRDEMGICYYVKCGHDAYKGRGYFAIASGVAKGRIEEALRAILGECLKVMSDDVSPEELKKAKELRRGNLYLNLESSDEYADFFAFPEMFELPLRTPEERIAKIDEVTAKDIKKAAMATFKKEIMNLAIVGPYKDEKPFVEILESFQSL